ncbi:MAG TPA: farnesyl diphosphate synthase [Chthoniobacteraceae bacterium]|nr:farnesyl diphosphate synthase [Chthoniobacteraceae bacterium]
MSLDTYLRTRARLVDRALQRALPPERARPGTIHKAMRYSVFAGGKRLRPILSLAAAEACGGELSRAMPAACAIECVHTYSLIHDDLPCMDDDDLRRGRPTNHKVFGEGIAVLAGDALLTVAFEILAAAPATRRYPVAILVGELARAAGSRSLIAGQVLDLEGESRKTSLRELQFIHRAKTAALLTAAIRLGAMSANASAMRLKALTRFGEALGLAFQIIDDILDVTQTTKKLGKTAGKDVAATKATYPAIVGLDRSRREAQRLTMDARAALARFRHEAARLIELSDFLLDREY